MYILRVVIFSLDKPNLTRILTVFKENLVKYKGKRTSQEYTFILLLSRRKISPKLKICPAPYPPNHLLRRRRIAQIRFYFVMSLREKFRYLLITYRRYNDAIFALLPVGRCGEFVIGSQLE